MTFYQSIAPYYDLIFPLDTTQIDFVKRSIDVQSPKVLDVGCGTGGLSLALAGLGMDVIGIDYDSEMIEIARHKADPAHPIKFERMDMREISGNFLPHAFDRVICFGNTLVHLDNSEEIGHFFRQVRSVLKSGGKFLLQILNYDYILRAKIKELPSIENRRIRFERFYEIQNDRILFRTVLTVKSTNRVIANEVVLYPLRKTKLDVLLRNADFKEIQYYGDFIGSPFMDKSLPLVVRAS